MKKQILILALFVMAMFANVTNSYGQPGHLTPTPGTEYEYLPTVTSTNSSTGATYLWYIIDASVSSDLVGGAQLAAGTYFTVNGNNTSSSIKLTWTAAAVLKTFYLVYIYSETSTLTGCTVKNMKSYEIKPASTLLLTVTKANADGTDNTESNVCAPTLATASVVPGSPSNVTYTYNNTVLYYKIKAEGMDGTWRPSLSLPTLPGSTLNGQTYASVEWATYTATPTPTIGTWANFPGTLANVVVVPVTNPNGMVSTTNYDVSIAGKEYLVRVTIDNARYESLNTLSVPLAVDGYLPTGYSVSDIIGSGATPWAEASAFAKSDTYTIVARPGVAPAVTIPASPFINQVP